MLKSFQKIILKFIILNCILKNNLKLYIEINFSNQDFTLHVGLIYLFLTF